MAITKQKKIAVVDELSKDIQSAESVTFIAFDKLSMSEVTDLRRTLAKAGVSYQVVKKTLLSHSLTSKSVTSDIDNLSNAINVTDSAD